MNKPIAALLLSCALSSCGIFDKYAGSKSDNGISYHGGPIMGGVPDVYLIFYGDWLNDPYEHARKLRTVLPQFILDLDGSDYLATIQTYPDNDGHTPTGNIRLNGMTTIGPEAFGTALTPSMIPALLKKAYPTASDGIFVVVLASGITYPDICTSACGKHFESGRAQVAIVGGPSCNSGCGPLTSSDFTCNTVVHEIAEAITNPDGWGWYAPGGDGEIADKCEGGSLLGLAYPSPANRSHQVNVQIGFDYYLLAGLWLNQSGGKCTLGLKWQPSH
jgi:hypothetical protein